MNPWSVAEVALIALFLVAQLRFYTVHRRRYGAWRPLRQCLLTGPSTEERMAMLRATFHRDSDPEVERSRRLYLIAFGSALAYAVLISLSHSVR